MDEQVGKKNRAVGSTLMNQDSSRSHSVLTVTVEAQEVTLCTSLARDVVQHCSISCQPLSVQDHVGLWMGACRVAACGSPTLHQNNWLCTQFTSCCMQDR